MPVEASTTDDEVTIDTVIAKMIKEEIWWDVITRRAHISCWGLKVATSICQMVVP